MQDGDENNEGYEGGEKVIEGHRGVGIPPSSTNLLSMRFMLRHAVVNGHEDRIIFDRNYGFRKGNNVWTVLRVGDRLAWQPVAHSVSWP